MAATLTKSPTGTRKASSANGGTKSRVHMAVFGAPVHHLRTRFERRPKQHTPHGGLTKIVGFTALIILAFWAYITGLELKDTLSNPGWWAVAWFVAGLIFMAGGHLFHLLPKSNVAKTQMITAWILGFFAVPFIAAFIVAQNLIVGMVAALFSVPFLITANHYCRRVTLYAEGYHA